MFAMLLGNINPIVEHDAVFAQGVQSVGVNVTGTLVVLAVMMLFMALVVCGVVCLIVWLCRRGSSDNGLKQTITEQQTQIDDMKRELEEVKRKLGQ